MKLAQKDQTAPKATVNARVLAAVGLAAAAILVLLAILPLVASPYVVNLALRVLLFATLALGLNVFTGLTGYVNFGYSGLLGLGAYVFAISVAKYQQPWPAGLAAAGVASALFSLLIGLPLLRVRGVYFAIATLGVAGALRVLTASEYLQDLTNAAGGILILTGVSLNGQYYLILGLCLVSLAVMFGLLSSKFGLQLLAIREDELAAEVLGIPAGLWKLVAFVASGTIGGLAGALLAMYLTYIDPSIVYDVTYSLRPLVMLLFGGFGTLLGPLLGAVFFTMVSELIWSRFLTYHLLIFGVVLVALVLLMPEGVIPWLQRRGTLPRSRLL